MTLTVSAVKAEIQKEKFDVFEVIETTLQKSQMELQNGDVLVISSKYISNSQGRLIDLKNVKTSKQGIELSKKFQIKPNIAEVIIRESDVIFGGVAGFVITSSDSIMAPNAGIDKSNTKKGKVILYPEEPYLIAEQIRRKIFLKHLIHVGIIIVDSRLMPARVGTIGIAISCAGIEPVIDMRAEKDLDGNPLKVTFQAVVDNLASIANHKMGEAAESKPFAIIRNSEAKLTDRKINPNELTVSHDQCVYVRGLKNSPR
ncbi:MAG TPA: coenzyme F420-0:L-glutamate ligase [Nitrosopumilaceae archaeon]|nr:coenzyme F420-0:L-glutamate ligase [Nitrosopumilaceae archaeon]